MKNKISDLRDHMFAQLERLSNEELTPEQLQLEISRGQALSDIGKVIVDSAKTEIMAAKIMKKQKGTGFIDEAATEAFTEQKVLERPKAEYSNKGHLSLRKEHGLDTEAA